MSLLQKIKTTLSRSGDLSKLDAAFDEENILLPFGLKMYYEGIEGIDEERIVVREYNNGTTGKVLAKIEYVQAEDTWYISYPLTTEVTKVPGKTNYTNIAQELNRYLKSLTE